MNGVLGLAHSTQQESFEPIWRRMIGSLSPTSSTASFRPSRGQPMSIARVSFGEVDAAPPTTSADGQVEVCCHGVLWNATALTQRVSHGPHPLRNASTEELILRLYQAEGADFLAELNGELALTVVDRAAGEVLVATDLLGMVPTYFAAQDGRLCFAPTVHAVLAALPRRTLDLTALAQYMRFQGLLGDRTFFEEVRLLPRGSVLRFRLRDGVTTLSRYADVAHAPPPENRSFADAVDLVGHLLDTAVQRRSTPKANALFLTGGLDSRLLLAALRRQGHEVHSFTYGSGDSRDVVYARRVARLAGASHRWCPVTDGRWVEAHAAAHLDRTEGFHPWLHGHGINTLAAVRASADVLFTGWGGGTVVGGWLNFIPIPPLTRNDPDLLAVELFRWFNRYRTWPGLSEAEEYALYAPAWTTVLRGRAFLSLREEVGPYMDCREDLRAELFFVFNHDLRFLQPWTSMLRASIPTAAPYFDLDLFRGVYALPASVRGYRLLMRALLHSWAPRLGLVPYDRDDLLPTMIRPLRTAHKWATRVTRRINAHIAPVFPAYRSLALDYEHWTRTDLRTWAADLLTSERTLARGLFNPNVLRALWERMQAGHEPHVIGKVAPLMTYELMLRRFYDPR